MDMGRCAVCGYVYDGDGEEVRISALGAELIARSRHTNEPQMRPNSLHMKAEWISESCVEDNLDPGCPAIFKTMR